MDNRYYKKIYSHCEFYNALVLAIRSAKHLRLNRKQKLVSAHFKERIMLAVTEVNGCEACSFAHTKFALEEGMSAAEIEAILSGDTGAVPQHEMVGIFFAQHYADNRGKSSKKSWQRLVDEYGEDIALVLLAFIRIMSVGNIYGIAYSAISDRIKGKPSGKTTLLYELSMMFSILPYAPAATIHAIFDNIRKKSIYPF